MSARYVLFPRPGVYSMKRDLQPQGFTTNSFKERKRVQDIIVWFAIFLFRLEELIAQLLLPIRMLDEHREYPGKSRRSRIHSSKQKRADICVKL